VHTKTKRPWGRRPGYRRKRGRDKPPRRKRGFLEGHWGTTTEGKKWLRFPRSDGLDYWPEAGEIDQAKGRKQSVKRKTGPKSTYMGLNFLDEACRLKRRWRCMNQ